jgi:hypothetical protein
MDILNQSIVLFVILNLVNLLFSLTTGGSQSDTAVRATQQEEFGVKLNTIWYI